MPDARNPQAPPQVSFGLGGQNHTINPNDYTLNPTTNAYTANRSILQNPGAMRGGGYGTKPMQQALAQYFANMGNPQPAPAPIATGGMQGGSQMGGLMPPPMSAIGTGMVGPLNGQPNPWLKGYASGGIAGAETTKRHMPHAKGLLHSRVPGRTDLLPTNVKEDSFVIPADVVSGLGEGNTVAGAHLLDKIFHDGKHQKSGYSNGGSVPIMAAGGEYIVPTEAVTKVGGGDLKKGHEILHHFVKHIRKKTAATLKKLPGPKK